MSWEIKDKPKLEIMVVEDSPATRKKYKKEIGNEYHVDYFSNARSALMSYSTADYDLVITDLMLPFKSGEALVFDIRYINPMQKIVVVSGSTKALNWGTNNIHVFSKPVNIKNVIENVMYGAKLDQGNVNELISSKRRYERFAVDLSATVISPEAPRRAKVANIGLGGLFLLVDEIILPDTNIFQIEVKLLEKHFNVSAQKRWVQKDIEGARIQGVGVQFYEIGHTEYSFIELYLESLK